MRIFKGGTCLNVSKSLDMYSNVIVAEIEKKSMLLPILISSEKDKGRTVETKALLDTGAGGKFIDQNFILANGIRTSKLDKPIMVYNVDGTKNKTGTITHYVNVNLQIREKKTAHRLMVTGLGKQKVILGFPWFEEMNPEINWKEATLTWKKDIFGHRNLPWHHHFSL